MLLQPEYLNVAHELDFLYENLGCPNGDILSDNKRFFEYKQNNDCPIEMPKVSEKPKGLKHKGPTKSSMSKKIGCKKSVMPSSSQQTIDDVLKNAKEHEAPSVEVKRQTIRSKGKKYNKIGTIYQNQASLLVTFLKVEV